MVNPIGRFSRAGDTHTFVLGLLVLVTMAEVAPYVAVSIPLPEAGDGVTATVIISSVLAVFVGLRPISGALPGRGVGYLRGFPTRNRGEVFGLVLLVCCWAIMLGVGILVLSGTTNSSVHSGECGWPSDCWPWRQPSRGCVCGFSQWPTIGSGPTL